MDKAFWKSGSMVEFISGGRMLTVVGYDSVGSVICEPRGSTSHERVYVPSALLIDAGRETEPLSRRDDFANRLSLAQRVDTALEISPLREGELPYLPGIKSCANRRSARARRSPGLRPIFACKSSNSRKISAWRRSSSAIIGG
jgi:hypothetical protein